MEARRTPLSGAPWWAAYSVPLWPRSSLFLRCLAYCMECALPAPIRKARKWRIPMPEIKHQQKGGRRLVFSLGLVLAAALGFFIYSGIHGRVEAEANLQHATEAAAIEDVSVVCP